MKPTYLEQEKHLHEQYIAGLIQPLLCESCICGNMLGERIKIPIHNSRPQRYWPLRTYSHQELSAIEEALFKGIMAVGVPLYVSKEMLRHPRYELGLFNGMVKALAVLREIHLKHGEIIEDQPAFTRRPIPEPV